ncbi:MULTISPECIES: hypothetical protein [unclassified Marinobacter]|uniref:hypothetical protein n=1 Tax=unclassified Marinobacter TaxID=83889 RepID=UPI001927E9E2|nr:MULTISPECIES: hypothetical protein [unclassified Marinobacter]MBL3823677.1 hypothetical protein [Marinobacter sp. MC3]MBL3891833.1 hypothetical protein [Marinobacter sp. MW3]
MRHSCIFAAVSMTTLVLSGCGLEDTGPSAFNPATNVDLTFSSFDLQNTEVAPDNLSHTRFWDFYRGIQPAADDVDDLETTGEIRSHIEIFTRATPTDAGTSYDSVRNPLDLMNQVLASGEVTNFQEGKRYISQRIADGVAGTYNTRGNGAQIRFTDQSAVIANLPLNDQLWIYPTLDWRYLPDGPEGSDLENKVYRTIQYVSRSVEEEDQAAQPELVSVLAGSRFDANSFMTLGYSPTEFATADYLSRNYGSIELRQDFIDENTDTLFIKNQESEVIKLDRYPGYTREDNHPDCLRIELDYNMERVRIFASDGEPARIDDPDSTNEQDTIANPANCTYQEDADAVTTWGTVAIAER